MQAGLVGLGVQNVFALLFEHFGGEVGVRERGVGGHHRAPQRGQRAEQAQGRLVLVGGRLDGHLGDHGGGLRGVGGEQVDAGDGAVAAAAEDLAVDGDVLPAAAVASGEPLADRRVEAVGVEVAEELGQGVGARHLAASEAQGVAEAVAAEPAELGDGGEAGLAGEDGDEGEAEECREGVLSSVAAAGVGQVGEEFEERAGHARDSGWGESPDTQPRHITQGQIVRRPGHHPVTRLAVPLPPDILLHFGSTPDVPVLACLPTRGKARSATRIPLL